MKNNAIHTYIYTYIYTHIYIHTHTFMCAYMPDGLLSPLAN